jgi:hypothetical protein
VSVGYTVTAPSSRSLDFNAYLSSADAPPAERLLKRGRGLVPLPGELHHLRSPFMCGQRR